MSLRSAGAFFARLIPAIISDLRRIANRSRGETTVEDLQAEAWLVAEELSRDRDPPPDAGDKGFHQQILGRLYNRFVKFADKRLRFAVRLDEQREDDEGGMRENPIAAALAAPEDYDPSRALEKREDERGQELQVLGHFAEAVAYLRIFAAMKNDRCAIADHLAIAACTLRRRMKRAEWVVKLQPSLFDGITAIPDDFMPPRHIKRLQATGNPKGCRPFLFTQVRLFAQAYIPIRRI
ncbi:hypothetical protein [Ralstonia solanacearum]|uniref:hypothetical protein n=1 Tax=Ralstonia solanacearum TaxID=305 RepID=UPI00078C3EAF|nr:hypothetical protein [Ralstonia solanacearum]AMP37325.1 hypothetical protein LBM2029_07120 [Ralstonia solanacearum]AXV86147.1 hypothetical protein CJO78_07395 [Ralstonia solanacearum]AXW05655.1 hypothetical protein CJO82_07170 [Ralstonia solanacearum]AXW23396.1 hypothetical protein CJO86_07175 [Ralstonia solanacearum]AXW80328.1 hypothetical protein CJO98_07405 [Ralstonia solanacearum]